jgi:hypothetical protein
MSGDSIDRWGAAQVGGVGAGPAEVGADAEALPEGKRPQEAGATANVTLAACASQAASQEDH